MGYAVEIKEEALEDLRIAFSFYEESVDGLGHDFLSEFEESLSIVQSNPYLFQEKQKPFREVKINKFPFLIVYEVEGQKVIIYAVFHTSRSPKKKYRKP